MKRKIKKITANLLVTIMALSLFGCAGNKKGGQGTGDSKHNGGKEVEIKYTSAGAGTEWIEQAIAAFNEKQSDYYAYYTSSASQNTVMAAYGQEDIDTVDLYVLAAGSYDDKYKTPLNDLLDATADGDSVPLKKKFSEQFLELAYEADGNIYTLPYIENHVGIVYNKKLFAKAGIDQTPRTTNELSDVCDLLVDSEITPWIHFKNGTYYTSWRLIMQAQYDGMEYYFDTFRPLKSASAGESELDILTKKDGRYQALKVMGSVLTPDNVVLGSNSMDFISAQTMFINQDIGMMVNGSWMANEMESVGAVDDFEVMKYPVVSAIVDKLTTVKTDSLLRELVSAIDSVVEGSKNLEDYQDGEGYLINGATVSAEDWDYVWNARNISKTSAANDAFIIPTYSDQTEGAKEFLKFFYSDEWCYKHMDLLKIKSPLNIDEEAYNFDGWNGFQKSFYQLATDAKHHVPELVGGNLHRVFDESGTDDYGNTDFITDLCSTNQNDRRTVNEIWDIVVKNLTTRYEAWRTK